MARVTGTETGADAIAVAGMASGTRATGVLGKGDAVGVRGEAENWHGVAGRSNSRTGGNGVFGWNPNGTGVRGGSKTEGNAAVLGFHEGEAGWGVRGDAPHGMGTVGVSDTGRGVYGVSKSQAGVMGESTFFDGVFGLSHDDSAAGVAGHNNAGGYGVYGRSRGWAGYFDGWVKVVGQLLCESGMTFHGALCRGRLTVTDLVNVGGKAAQFILP